MADTYSQMLIHVVFAVKHRQNHVKSHFREDLQMYITGIIQNNGHKMLAIYCMPDHCHVLIGFNPKQSVADLMRIVKSNSSKWMNDRRYFQFPFQWQGGYGVFSYAPNSLKAVVNYILTQPEHHKKKCFRDEYVALLEQFNIDFKEEYIFNNGV